MVNGNLSRAISEIEYFLLDMDGTVYLGDQLIGEMDRTLRFLRGKGKKLIYLTNNSSKSNSKYVEKLKRMNLFDDGDEVYTSGMATADLIMEKYADKSVYLLGTDALKEEFKAKGVRLIEDGQPDIAVLAYDTELTYEKLCKFTTAIKKGAYYIATHPDVNCPAPEVFVPDIGSFMAMIELSTGLKPSEIVGKPFDGMGKALMKRLSLKENNFVMVGDRLHTDIKFGNNCGFYTILVLSGESVVSDIEKSDAKPTFVLNSLNDIKSYFGQ